MKKIISGKVREVYDLEDGRMVIVQLTEFLLLTLFCQL